MEKENKASLVTKIISIVINISFGVFMIVHLCLNIHYTAQIAALFMVLSGAIKLTYFFLAGEYVNPKKAYEMVTNPTLIILGFIYMITKANPWAVCITYGIIDIVDGLLGITFRSLEIKHHRLAILEVCLSIGDLVFGILLTFEGIHGLRMHLIFLTITIFAYVLIEILEPLLDKKHH